MAKQKMTRDTVPEDFTLSLALVDGLPVLFFGGSMILAGVLLKSWVFLLGAGLCLFAGAAKVLWKIIVALKRKNIWWLFLQMRILMPIGMVMMIASAAVGSGDWAMIWQEMCSLPAAGFFCAGLAGMVLMLVFAFTLDSSNVKANWIEQLTNGIAQAAFFIGLLTVVL